MHIYHVYYIFLCRPYIDVTLACVAPVMPLRCPAEAPLIAHVYCPCIAICAALTLLPCCLNVALYYSRDAPVCLCVVPVLSL